MPLLFSFFLLSLNINVNIFCKGLHVSFIHKMKTWLQTALRFAFSEYSHSFSFSFVFFQQNQPWLAHFGKSTNTDVSLLATRGRLQGRLVWCGSCMLSYFRNIWPKEVVSFNQNGCYNVDLMVREGLIWWDYLMWNNP